MSRVIEQNPNSIVVATLAGAIEYVNPRTVEATGYSLGELVGQDIRVLCTSEAPDKIEHALLEVINHGKEWRGETLSRKKTGEEILYEEVSLSPIQSPEGKITHFVMTKQDISQRKRFELALQESEERYRQLFENNPQPMWAYHLETLAFLEVNNAAVRHYGYSRQEFLAKTLNDIRQEDVPAVKATIDKVHDTPNQIGVWQHIKKDGSVILVEVISGVMSFGGRDSGIALVNDMTEKMRAEKEKSALEHQLRQSQKMEAIGTLAGGIAHDFNNILTAIIGHATLMQMKMEHDAPLQRKVKQILTASDRATKLTQALLSYSRKQVTDLVPVALNSIINKSKSLLRRLITEDIHFDLLLAEEELAIMADTGQIEQVLMNLVVNARDAMCHGGELCIATESVTLDRDFIAAHGYGIAGDYALLTVTDSGVGMDENTRKRIFEPFFTTKEVDKGTGLGLAVAYGIVKQHGGYINCYSEPGHGTVFRIYLPLTDAPLQRMVEAVVSDATGGYETILLVEDDAELREMMGELLEDYGYTVIKAVDGEDAVHKFTELREAAQMVILDVIMPKMNGKDAYEKISALSNSVKVLFMSGYPADIVTRKSLIDGYYFVQKPLNTKAFLNKVREILDSTERPCCEHQVRKPRIPQLQSN